MAEDVPYEASIPYSGGLGPAAPLPTGSLLKHLGSQQSMGQVIGALHPCGSPWLSSWIQPGPALTIVAIGGVGQWIETPSVSNKITDHYNQHFISYKQFTQSCCIALLAVTYL